MSILGAKFTALAVGGKWPGEAILWNVDGSVAAVDLGANEATGTHVATQHPRILLLTHDDDDHIGGWDGFAAEANRMQRWPEEIWMPYEWGALAIAAASTRPATAGTQPARATPDGVFEELGIDKWTVVSRREGHDTGDDRGGSVLDTIDWDAAHKQVAALGDSGELAEHVEAVLDPEKEEFEGIGTRREVAERAVDSVQKILRIIGDVHRSSAAVKLFSIEHAKRDPEPQPWFAEGLQGLITVPNGRKVEPASLTAAATVQHLAMLYTLSIQNRRALTALLWTCCCVHSNKAMAWSDSSGEWVIDGELEVPTGLMALATAPHHGSAKVDHTDAWTAMWGADPDLVLVAAGGQYNQQVNGAFLAAPHEQRACNRCRHTPMRPVARHVIVHVPYVGAATLMSAHCGRP